MPKNRMRIRLNRKIVFGGMFVISLLIIMISVSFSWFYQIDVSTVNVGTITMIEVDSLMVKKTDENEDWGKTLELTVPEGFAFNAVTGDGNNFYLPELELDRTSTTANGVYDHYTVAGYTPIDAAKLASHVYSFDFSVHIANEYTLFLAPGSTVTPSDAESAPKSILASELNAGEAAAALRVALFQKVDDTYQLKCIWAPNMTTKLEKTPDGSYAIDHNSADIENLTFVTPDDTAETGYAEYMIDTAGQAKGRVQENGVTYVWGDLTEETDKVALGELSANTVCDYRLVVWLDGNDRECHNAFFNGQISVNIKLTADTLE